MGNGDHVLPKLHALVEYLDAYANDKPNDIAVVDGEVELNWSQLHSIVGAIAQGLKKSGLSSGQTLAFAGVPGSIFWATFLACQRIGAVWVGLNPQYTHRELLHVLADSRPSLVLNSFQEDDSINATLVQAAAEATAGRVFLTGSDVNGIASRLSRLTVRPEGLNRIFSNELNQGHVALIVYTSGSTGSPKGAMVTQTGLIENGWWLAKRLNFAPHRTLANLPINHIGCVGDVCTTALVSGGALVFMSKFDPAATVRLIREKHVEWIPQVPAQFQLMLSKGGLCQHDLNSVKCITWGGAAMARGLIEQLQEWVPDLFNSYGLTECSGTISVTRPGADIDVLADTVGAPVDPNLVSIADNDGNVLPLDESGEVRIRGKHLFHGYLNRPDATRESITEDGWLRSGDVGVLREDGNLCLLGRTHEMFKSGGYNVYPRELETVIESIPEVELCAVVSVPDELWQEVGVAYIQADPDVLNVDRVAAYCRANLANYKVPKRFIIRAELPLLPVGKVDKPLLRDEALGDG